MNMIDLIITMDQKIVELCGSRKGCIVCNDDDFKHLNKVFSNHIVVCPSNCNHARGMKVDLFIVCSITAFKDNEVVNVVSPLLKSTNKPEVHILHSK
jgi:hypothetical protein